jgi:hypothetical protein
MIINKIKNFIHNYIEFKKFLNEIKIHLDAKNIAIVGSAQRILNNKSGNLIDNFDLVLRFNAAPTNTYEVFVGKNTNIIACNSLIFTDQCREELIKENKDPLFILKQKNKIIVAIVENDFEIIKKNIFKFVDNSNKVFLFDNKLNNILRFHVVSKYNFFKKFYFYKYGPKLSIGLIILSIINILKIKSAFFGFDLNKNKNNMQYYYYTPKIEDHEKTAHDFELENKLIKKILFKNDRIDFY